MLYIFSGPSGSGKSTITEQLKDFKKIVTSTTRKPRKGEKNGIDYFFLDKNNFKNQKKMGKIIASTQYANNYYGVLIDVIKNNLEEEDKNLIIVDQEGIKDFKKSFNNKQIKVIYIHRNIKSIITTLKERNCSREEFLNRINQLTIDLQNIFLSDIIINNNYSIDKSIKQLNYLIDNKKNTTIIKKYFYYIQSKITLSIFLSKIKLNNKRTQY